MTSPARFCYIPTIKALLQTGSSGWAPVPPESDFLFRKELCGKRIRLIGFGVSGLQRTAESRLKQPLLFELEEKEPQNAPAPTRQKREAISRTMDQIRDRYGRRSVRRGSSLGVEE